MNYGDSEYVVGLHPYIDYFYEDKSKYSFANTKEFIDHDNDFRLGDSGGFLMNMDFIFIGTEQFSSIANNFYHTKRYCPFIENSSDYDNFWRTETIRRREGLTLNCKLYHKDVDEYFDPETKPIRRKELLQPLRITGDHYNYLNYSRIMRMPTEEEKVELQKILSKKKKIQAFPKFWDGDYWNFKNDEFILNNNYHLCKCKARRRGYSYKRGSQAANTVNLNTDVTVILGAYDIAYLTDKGATASMVKVNLDWYEDQTYWRRNYVSETLEQIHLGYKLSTGGNKIYGWNSAVLSESLYNNPSALIGKDPIEVDIEEAGKCPNFQEVLNVTFSGTEAGDELSGTLRAYGTGGARNADWAAFSDAFYNPNRNQMLPLENIWDNDARPTVCGFFHPQILNYHPYMDIHGNSYLITSFYKDVERKAYAREHSNPYDYNIFCAQRANSPSEAFIIGSTNIFSSPALTDFYKDLNVRKDKVQYRDGMIFEVDGIPVFKTHAEMQSESLDIHPYIEDVPIRKGQDPVGCIRMFHSPVRINNVIPDNLYCVVIDPIGKDIEEKELTVKHSLYNIQVWMYPNNVANSTGDLLVASYTGRPATLKEGSDIAILMTRLYNAKALPETDRGTVVTDFKAAGYRNLLLRDPMRIVKDENLLNIPYGVNVGGRSTNSSKADDITLQFKDFLYEKCSVTEDGEPVYVLHYIQDIAFIKELLKYNKKGNFDRISTGRLYPLARMAYRYKKVRPIVASNEQTLIGSLRLYN